MNRPRSFRGRLALRLSAAVLLVLLAGSLLGYQALRRLLFEELDRTLLRLAGIEAAAAADSPDADVHFHDAVFLVSNSSGGAGLDRYAEIWTRTGQPVLRTSNLGAHDLPLDPEIFNRVVRSGSPEIFPIEWRSGTYRGVLYPLGLVGSQHEPHVLQVIASVEPSEALLAVYGRWIAAMTLLGTVGGFAIGWWIAGTAVRPITQIIEQAESVEMTAEGHEIRARAETDEIERLVNVLNSMLARIDAAFTSQRRFLADVGHEIRTPLTVLRGDIEVALRRVRSAAEYESILRQALKDLRSVSALAGDLVTLARGEGRALQPALRDIAAGPLLESAATAYNGAAAEAGARIEIVGETGVLLHGDRALLERAIGNLLDNAIKYGAGGGRITLNARSAASGDVEIAVADRGPGIPPEERVRVFERFFRGSTGRRSGRGSGLGLAIVAAIVEGHGGSVTLVPTPGGERPSYCVYQGRALDPGRPGLALKLHSSEGAFDGQVLDSLPRCAARVLAALALLLYTPAVIQAQEEPPAEPSAAAEVRTVVEEFHAALAAGDSTRALEYLHPEVVVYEAGHAESLAEYRSGHLASDIEFSRAVTFETVRDTVIVGRELSLYLREYRMTGSFRDREIDAHGVETIVLGSTEEGWKIRHIHWSSR